MIGAGGGGCVSPPSPAIGTLIATCMRGPLGSGPVILLPHQGRAAHIAQLPLVQLGGDLCGVGVVGPNKVVARRKIVGRRLAILGGGSRTPRSRDQAKEEQTCVLRVAPLLP